MARSLEADEVIAARLRLGRGKRTEPIVLPYDVLATLRPVSDPQPALARQTDETAIAEQRAEDDLELHRVGRDPADSDPGMFDHALEFDRRLRRSAGIASWSLLARLGVAEPHARELQGRRDDFIPDRPHVLFGA